MISVRAFFCTLFDYYINSNRTENVFVDYIVTKIVPSGKQIVIVKIFLFRLHLLVIENKVMKEVVRKLSIGKIKCENFLVKVLYLSDE